MADQKITELDALTTPISTDILTIVDDVIGTPINKKIEIETLATSELFNVNSLSRQAIINGGFTVNQRVYATSGTLASGSYGHDRWKAGAGGGDYTFTQLASSTQITIEAGKTLIQVIEDKNVVGGTYTLSWTGTAQARAGVDSATPSGGYADSPLAITAQTAGTVMSVEFDDGTLSEVQLNLGSIALPFMPKSYAQELADCKRYFERIQPSVAYQMLTSGFCTATTNGAFCLLYEEKRIAPTFTFTAGSTFAINHGSDAATAVTSIAINAGRYGNKSANVHTSVASGLTVGQGATLNAGATASSCYIDLSAEL